MNGQVIIPRRANGFEVAHRLEAGEHYLEVSIGSSFNELYWDFPAKRFVADPERYSDLPDILQAQGAGWLIGLIPKLAEDGTKFSTDDLRELASKA